MNIISEFTGEYRFLSNFWIIPDGRGKTVEHYYQASKASNSNDYTRILNAATPNEAKKLGKQVEIISNFDSIKLIIMEQLLRYKFSFPNMAVKLLSTNDAILQEGNTWNDTFWGICDNIGQNNLGKLLMKIRDNFLTIENIKEYN
jgi:ribA/ribD-fused uncharacterized protein